MSPELPGARAPRRRASSQATRGLTALCLVFLPLLAESHTYKYTSGGPNPGCAPAGAACPSGQARRWRLNPSSPWLSATEIIADSKTWCDYNIANGGYGHCAYATTFCQNASTEAVNHQWKADDFNLDPYVYTYQTYSSQCLAFPRILSLQAGGQLAAGETLHGGQVQVTFDGQPAAGIPVQISAQPQEVGTAAGNLYPAVGEGASCTSGAVMDCITDADGTVNFDFVAPAEDQPFDALHDITATCSDPTKPCSPNTVGPQVVTVTGCPLTLSLRGGGNVDVNEVLEGQNVTVRNCLGQAKKDVDVQVVVTPVEPPLGPSGGLRLEGGSGAGSAAVETFTDLNGEIRLEFVAPATKGAHALTARCTDSAKPCSPDPAGPLEIRVNECIELTLSSENQVMPGKPLALTLESRHCDQNPAPLVPVEIDVSVKSGSGFHGHADGERPKGTLASAGCEPPAGASTISCTTGPDGKLSVTFGAPEPAGEHQISAKCVGPGLNCSPAAPKNIKVKVDGLEQLPPSQWYSLTYFRGCSDPQGCNIGDNGRHDGNNHYMTLVAGAALEELAYEYLNSFEPPSTQKIYINDASLPWGGLFDIRSTRTWKSPHSEHRYGTEVDIRANAAEGAVPFDQFDNFKLSAESATTAFGYSITPRIECTTRPYQYEDGTIRPPKAPLCALPAGHPDGPIDTNRHFHVRFRSSP